MKTQALLRLLGIRTTDLPGAVVNNRLILIGHGVEHSQLTEHVHHEIQEALVSSPLHDSAEEGEGVGGVKKSGACIEKKTQFFFFFLLPLG